MLAMGIMAALLISCNKGDNQLLIDELNGGISASTYSEPLTNK